MKRWLGRLFVILSIAAVSAVGYAVFVLERQGLSPGELSRDGATVTMDDRGIPTIEAKDWETVAETQGFVVASDRLFQMDLYRRVAGGRLAEFFGPSVVKWDRRHREEDWAGVAERAASSLDSHARGLIEAYTRGVNRFIEAHEGRWGIEYRLLGARPEPWTPRDSMLVMLQMCDQLAVAAHSEAERELWREKLPPEWYDFLFPQNHPWNEPLFGGVSGGITLPATKLEKKKVDPTELSALGGRAHESLGSNSWGWCGKTGCFLANDPHLGASVPHLWYAVRLRTSPKDWVVGVSIPGLPGVVLGMNPYLAWAFTNVGEDVDDYLLEEVDGERYVAAVQDGRKIYEPIETRPYEIRVRGGETVKGVARFTRRGPLSERPHLEGLYSRQWLPLKEGVLSFASRLNFAKSWEEVNAALDGMSVPAQNVLVIDRRGNLGYRASGTGVVRRISGRRPQNALEGEWVGLQPRRTRPRLLFYAKTATLSSDRSRFIATANQRIWVDEYGHRWAEDLRHARIREVLAARDDFGREDMNALQLDTKSEYHRRLVSWVAAHAEPEAPREKATVARWKKWSGVAKDDPDAFTEALEVERLFTAICLSRVRARFGVPADHPYYARLDSGWILEVLGREGGVGVFGLDEADTATSILRDVARVKRAPYYVENRWQAQHPFAGRIPVVGDLFSVEEHHQHGWSGIVRVERPKYGASTRLVWDLSDPKNSTWSLPVGQSGHVRSSHYADLQEDWAADRPMKVFDDRFEWWFAPARPSGPAP